jgi:hypothetical protein
MSTKHYDIQYMTEEKKIIWRPSHRLKSNGAARYILGLGMLPKRFRGRVHVLAKMPRVLQQRSAA